MITELCHANWYKTRQCPGQPWRLAGYLLAPWEPGLGLAVLPRVLADLELAYRAGLRPDALVAAWRACGCPTPGVSHAVLVGSGPCCLLERLLRLVGFGRLTVLLGYFEVDQAREMGLFVELGRWRR